MQSHRKKERIYGAIKLWPVNQMTTHNVCILMAFIVLTCFYHLPYSSIELKLFLHVIIWIIPVVLEYFCNNNMTYFCYDICNVSKWLFDWIFCHIPLEPCEIGAQFHWKPNVIIVISKLVMLLFSHLLRAHFNPTVEQAGNVSTRRFTKNLDPQPVISMIKEGFCLLTVHSLHCQSNQELFVHEWQVFFPFERILRIWQCQACMNDHCDLFM